MFVKVAFVFAVLGVFVYLFRRIMARQGSVLFRIGYFFYTRTRLGYRYHRRDVDKAARKYPNGHSDVEPSIYGDLSIIPVPMVMDNYSYIIHDKSSNTCVLVDPSVPEVVQASLDSHNLIPNAILTTHKHWDHSGGNRDLKRRYRGLQVYGGAHDRVSAGTHSVNDGEVIQLGNLRFTTLFTPGHTVGHVAYLLDGTPFSAPDSVFTGDMLFVGGVGRMFECSPSVMLESLDKLASLPETTLVWPGHEYASDNMEFAASVDAENARLQEMYNWVQSRREHSLSTVPSSVGAEKSFNPFLRTHHHAILQAMGLGADTFDTEEAKRITRAKALSELRNRKDKFKYKL